MIDIKLSDVMKQHGITISELSEYTGLARSTITPLVNNPSEVKGIKIETLNVLCDFFGVPTQEIIKFIPESKKYSFINLIKHPDNDDIFYIIMKKKIGNANRYVFLSLMILQNNSPYEELYYDIHISIKDSEDKHLPESVWSFVENKNEILPAHVYLKDLERQSKNIKEQNSGVIVKYLIQNKVFTETSSNEARFNIYWEDFDFFDNEKKQTLILKNKHISVYDPLD